MIVLKLGGSVYHTEYLNVWLQTIEHLTCTPVVVVPGGSVFADQVRTATQRYPVGECCSHKMALLAMQQYGELLCGLNRKFVMAEMDQLEKVVARNRIPVWSPFVDIDQRFDGPKTWQTTSDSLSLWLATRLKSDCLYIVKSAEMTKRNSIEQQIEAGVLDEQFANFLPAFNGNIELLNVAEFERLEQRCRP